MLFFQKNPSYYANISKRENPKENYVIKRKLNYFKEKNFPLPFVSFQF